jgi:hypothetical protein
MRISKNTMIIAAIYLVLSISSLYFMTGSGDIPISKVIISFPVEFATSPINIVTIMLAVFWLTPEFVVISYCFHYFIKYQQKIAIYVLTRSKSVARNLQFIMIRIAGLIILIKSIRFILLAFVGNIGFEGFINQLGPYALSMIIPFIALQLICIAYLIRRDERQIIVYILLHLGGLLALIQFKSKYVNLLLYSIELKNITSASFISIIIIAGLFYTMIYLSRKVEY